ncbi:MAG: HepT-like ribonuclease domain-containing protein [Catalinimonas sp.]
MSERARVALTAIVEACDKIERFVETVRDADDSHQDQTTFDALSMNFLVIGASGVRLSDQIKASEGSVPWTRIKGFRNIVAHNYFGVDAEEVWHIIMTSLPGLKASVDNLLYS